ncbi:hypothetical protein [Paenibacillus sp. 1P07SE]|uniref:hypothetical protein n=1 Tax=Paenibacillus sp. 1P07SE TaxID=3132209 RepID=UPI0039A733D0
MKKRTSLLVKLGVSLLSLSLVLQALSWAGGETPAAYAAEGVTIGFEASEGYVVGDVNGQPPTGGGTKWSSNAPAGTSMFEVVEGIGPGGGRAIVAPVVNPALTNNRTLLYNPTAAELGADSLQHIKLGYSFDLMANFTPDPPSFSNIWTIGLGTAANTTDMAARIQVRGNGKMVYSYDDSNTGLIVKKEDGSDLVLEEGQWVTIQGQLDFVSKTYTLEVNGVTQLNSMEGEEIGFRAASLDAFHSLMLRNVVAGSNSLYQSIGIDNVSLMNLTEDPGGEEPGERTAKWHQVSLRTAWERDQQLTGGDGSQVPRYMVFSPKNNYETVFMGVDTAGLYRSDDGGASWTSKMEGIDAFYVKTIAVDPGNEDVVYAFVGGNPTFNSLAKGLYLSEDNGESWVKVEHFRSQQPPANARLIGVFPDNHNPTLDRANELLVGSHDGLYKTNDGGATFVQKGQSTVSGYVTSILIDPVDPDVVYAATNQGLYRSVDRGETFASYTAGLPSPLAVAAMAIDPDGTIVYAIVNSKQVYRNVQNSGWTAVTAGLPTPAALNNGTFYDIQVHPADGSHLMLGLSRIGAQGNFYHSNDYGQSWTRIYHTNDPNRFAGSTANPEHAFAPDPTDKDTWLKPFNLGTIYKTIDSGQTWEWSSENYGGARFRRLVTNPHDPNHMVITTIDLGPRVTFDGGQSFEQASAVRNTRLDGMGGIMISEPGQTDSATVYAGIGMHSPVHEGDLQVSTDGGRQYSVVPGTNGKQKTKITIHPQDNDYIYAGDVISTDGGDTWSNISRYVSASLPGTFNQTNPYANPQESYDFGSVPVRISSNLSIGNVQGTTVTYRLADDDGNEVAVWLKREGAQTQIYYRIIDGSYDSGEQLHTAVNTATSLMMDVSPAYLRIKSTGDARMVPHSFENTDNYKLTVTVDHPDTAVQASATGLNVETSVVQIVGADPVDPEKLYLFDGLNVYRSEDAGESLALVNTLPDADPVNLHRNFIMSPSLSADGETMYIGFIDGVYLYDTATNTFDFKTYADGFVPNVDGTLHLNSLLIDPSDPDTIYAGDLNLTGGNGAGVFVSRDAGGTWAPMDQTGFFGTKRIWGLGTDGYGQLWAFTDQGPFWYGDLQLPGAPEQVTAVQSAEGIELEWAAAEEAFTYQVKRSTSATGPFEVIQGGVNGTSYLDESALPDTTYYYTVSGGNLVGEGPASAVVESSAGTGEPVDPLYPLTIEADQGLSRLQGIGASVRVMPTAGAAGHDGSEVILFQLMKNNTPVSYVALTKDFTQDEVVSGYFDVGDPENVDYTVHVLALDTLTGFESGMPVPLSDKIVLD